MEGGVCGKPRAVRPADEGSGQLPARERAVQRMHGRLFVVKVEIGINEVFLRQPLVICLEQLGIICHDGTVVMIDGIVLVEIVTLAGVEDEIHALVEKGLDVSVHEFGGIAGGIRRDGVLSPEIQLARAAVGKDDAESAGLEKLRPQRELFEHDQLHGQPHRPARLRAPAAAARAASHTYRRKYRAGLWARAVLRRARTCCRKEICARPQR